MPTLIVSHQQLQPQLSYKFQPWSGTASVGHLSSVVVRLQTSQVTSFSLGWATLSSLVGYNLFSGNVTHQESASVRHLSSASVRLIMQWGLGCSQVLSNIPSYETCMLYTWSREASSYGVWAVPKFYRVGCALSAMSYNNFGMSYT